MRNAIEKMLGGLALGAVLLCIGTGIRVMDQADQREETEAAPPVIVVAASSALPPHTETTQTPDKLVEEGYYKEDVPLDYALQEVLRQECEENGIPWAVALGLIETESSFKVDALNPSSGCVGLCQLNPDYFPADMTPEENIGEGLGYLGRLVERYDGDMEAALTAYNAGHDTGSRTYAAKVLEAAERWREE